MSLPVTPSTFQSQVLDYQGLVLVDFWAPWCGPCQMLSPIIDQIGQEQQAKVKVVKINVDESGDLAMRYNIASIPTVIFFDHGQIKTTIVGYRQKEDYLQAIDK